MLSNITNVITDDMNKKLYDSINSLIKPALVSLNVVIWYDNYGNTFVIGLAVFICIFLMHKRQ
ncbi:hypothetical protein ACFL0T_07065 [Candidatus Omnitrophota bacterium]